MDRLLALENKALAPCHEYVTRRRLRAIDSGGQAAQSGVREVAAGHGTSHPGPNAERASLLWVLRGPSVVAKRVGRRSERHCKEDYMKRSSGSRRPPSDLSESVHQQINMYALAASAAGVSLLALAQPSEAKIVYTHAHVVISAGDSNYKLDLNHDGITDVTISASGHFGFYCGPAIKASFFEMPTSGNGVEGSPPTPLGAGARIGGRKGFYGGKGLLASAIIQKGGHSCRHGGAWWNVTDRYLGVEFKIHKKIHYGWARFTFDRGQSATLTGYAYETIAGKSIMAGKTHGLAGDSSLDPDSTNPDEFGPRASANSIPDTPQPASLGMLALGAQVVHLWRRKQSVAGISENN